MMRRVMMIASMVLALGACGGGDEGLPDCQLQNGPGSWETFACLDGGTAGTGQEGNGFCIEESWDDSSVLRPLSKGTCVRRLPGNQSFICQDSPTVLGQCGAIVCTDTTCIDTGL